MLYISVLFREEVGRVVNTGAVVKSDFVKSNGIADGILANVVVSKAFRGSRTGPVNATLVVVVHRGRDGSIVEREIRGHVPDFEDFFGTVIGGDNLGLA